MPTVKAAEAKWAASIYVFKSNLDHPLYYSRKHPRITLDAHEIFKEKLIVYLQQINVKFLVSFLLIY